jgi:DNA-directed RNA polymerase specialized sigma24 family protein
MASPTDTDDSTLLQRYASTGDQSAFAELANRYVDFVYAAALRQTGWNTANAADVTQAIFLVFARRAGTVDPKSLSVWLHRVSGYAAANARRADARRRRHEREAATQRSESTMEHDDFRRLERWKI